VTQLRLDVALPSHLPISTSISISRQKRHKIPRPVNHVSSIRSQFTPQSLTTMPYLQLSHKRIFYTDYHPPTASSETVTKPRETFLFTHGLGSSQNYYTPLIPIFLSQNFRCITFDTTGSARSPYTQIEQSTQSLASDVFGILDALNVEKAVMVGHSMGAIVAAESCVRDAAEGKGRIVASMWIGPVYPSKAVSEAFEKRVKLVEKHGMGPLANTIPEIATGRAASGLTKAFIRELLLGQDASGYRSNCRVIMGARVPEYGKVRCPVLVLAGEEDQSAPLSGCERMLKELGTEEKSLEILEGVGHWHCLEAPEEVAERILGFYRQIQ
jgi:pimeloyl-ACP methyl ester carboxylesterase